MTTAATQRPQLFDRDTREQRHRETVAGVNARASQLGRAKSEAMDRIKAELVSFIEALGVGERFQGVDFMRRCEERDIDWHPLDPRALGPLLAQLVRVGVIRRDGFEMTGGLKSRNCNSSPRVVYRIECGDLTPLGWRAAA